MCKDITLSMDLSSECPFVEIMIFQYVNGQWTVPTNKFCATTTSWKRESYTFKLDKNVKDGCSVFVLMQRKVLKIKDMVP